MKQPKTTYLILSLIFLVIVLVAVQILKAPKDQGGAEQVEQQTDFKVISSSSADKPIGVTEPVKITFSGPVALESVIYRINPQEQVTLSLDSTKTEVIFEHIQAWDFDTSYTIKILKSTKSKDGLLLDKDYEFTFKTIPYTGI